MALARQNEQGEWEIWTGRNEVIDGRRLTASRLDSLYRDGIWSEAELNDLGIRVVVKEDPPAGQRDVVGTRRLVDIAGQLTSIADYEPIPPPPIRTPLEKWTTMLAEYDLTPTEVDSILASRTRQ